MKDNILKIISVAVIVVVASIPLINLVVLGIANLEIDPSRSLDYEQLGQVGDFFGGHTAAFSGLVSVLLIMYFSRRQLRQQEKHFEQQILISKQSADLSSITNIYGHYDAQYGSENDSCAILRGIATGHRRWAIRESFSIIDPDGALEMHRKEQVDADFRRLVVLASGDEIDVDYYEEFSRITSSLLLDKRLIKERRVLLWDMYELLRENPIELTGKSGSLHRRLRDSRKRLVDASAIEVAES